MFYIHTYINLFIIYIPASCYLCKLKKITYIFQGIKCNPNHWPTLDKLITLLYASNEYVSCLYHISLSLNLDSGYLKGHFIKEIIYKKFPSLISYFKSYCSDGWEKYKIKLIWSVVYIYV